MFGYVTANRELLSQEELARYRSAYCGLCRILGEKYGSLGRMTLTYDMTFLILLLDALNEPELTRGTERCLPHPVRAHGYTVSPYTEYAADLNILLAYDNALDDWLDEKSHTKRLFAKALEPHIAAIEAKYPRQAKAVKDGLSALAEAEKNDAPADTAMNAFASLMGELFVPDETDHFAPRLRVLGESLGRYIYLLDAFTDIEKDCNNGSYNPLKERRSNADLPEAVKDDLTMLIAEGAAAFEQLPITEDAALLRNILYSGVWTRYQLEIAKRQKKEQKRA